MPTIYHQATGETRECHSIDAREILEASPDIYSASPPELVAAASADIQTALPPTVEEPARGRKKAAE